MPIIATAGDGKTFIPAPGGLHQGICVDVVDMGILEVTYAGQSKKQHKIRIVWQIDKAMNDGKPFIVQKRYTLSLHEKATLRKDLESWRGQAFTDLELKGFDLEKLIGCNAQLNVQLSNKDGKTYSNVVGIVPLARGMVKMKSNGYVRATDRTDNNSEPLTAAEIFDEPPF